MKAKLLAHREDFVKALLEETEPAFVNALRRVLIADVPKMAIEDVEFHLGPIRAEDGREYESVAPLFDEIVAHRLGLVPGSSDAGHGCPSVPHLFGAGSGPNSPTRVLRPYVRTRFTMNAANPAARMIPKTMALAW